MKIWSVALLASDKNGDFCVAMAAAANTAEDAVSQCYKLLARDGATWKEAAHSVAEVPEQFLRLGVESLDSD